MTTPSPELPVLVRFDNGFRLLLVDTPGASSVVVTHQFLGGSRRDPRGSGGVAHLTEHLMTLDETATDPRTIGLVEAAGGRSGATTHPDHLEFSHHAPLALLDTLLAAETRRLRATLDVPPALFEAQRDAVLQEILAQRTARPYGPLPCPGLGELLFEGWSDRHDVFGEPDEVAGLELADCQAFVDRTHGPGSAVLSLALDLAKVDLDAVIATVDAAVSPIPASAVPAPAASSARAEGVSDRVEREDNLAGTLAFAIGWPLPAFHAAPHGYLDTLLLAEVLDLAAGPRFVARVGRGRPMDTARDDVLTTTGIATDDASLDAQIAGVSDLLHAVADGTLDDADEVVASARARVAARVRSDHDDPAWRSRQAGLETLFGSTSSTPGTEVVAGHLPTFAAARRRAAELADHGLKVRVARPAGPGTTDAPARAQPARPSREQTPPPAAALPPPPGVPPTLAPPAAPPGARGTRSGGIATVAIPSAGSTTELRYLLPTAAPGPDVAVVAAALRSRGAPVPGLSTVQVTTVGDELEVRATVTGDVDPSAWTAALAGWLDDHRGTLGPERRVREVVAVGRLAEGFAGAAAGLGSGPREPAPLPAVDRSSVTYDAASPVERLELVWPLPVDPAAVPRRWLGLAVLNDVAAIAAGRPPAGLLRRAGVRAVVGQRRRRGVPEVVVHVARRAAADGPSLPALLDELVASLSGEAIATRARDLAPVRAVCTGQIVTATDAPVPGAELMVRLLRAGGSPDAVAGFARRLTEVDGRAIVPGLLRDLARPVHVHAISPDPDLRSLRVPRRV